MLIVGAALAICTAPTSNAATPSLAVTWEVESAMSITITPSTMALGVFNRTVAPAGTTRTTTSTTWTLTWPGTILISKGSVEGPNCTVYVQMANATNGLHWLVDGVEANEATPVSLGTFTYDVNHSRPFSIRVENTAAPTAINNVFNITAISN
jgi:hypothetical protein